MSDPIVKCDSTVRYRQDGTVWWVEDDAMPGWTAVGESLNEAITLHREAVLLRDSETAARLAAETIAAQQAEIRRLESKVAEMHRRAQEAESIIAKSGIVEGRPQGEKGRSVGRALANYAAEDYKRKLATLLVAAGAAVDYFTDKADADLRGDTFRGNRESDLANELSEAIRKAKGERP